MTETELLFSEILKCDRASLYLNGADQLTDKDSALVAETLKKRIAGEPIQYILGKADFFGLEFKVTPDCLIPRPETEILVETAVSAISHQPSPVSILDIGTGSGCIAVSLAKKFPEAKITATDISARAIEVARENAEFNGAKVNFIKTDLFPTYYLPSTTYNLIISNPPYVLSGEIDKLQAEVKCEPRIALDGGADGLEFYRRIIKDAPLFLRDNGILILEIGCGQAKQIEEIINNKISLKVIERVRDYSGIERVIVARKVE